MEKKYRWDNTLITFEQAQNYAVLAINKVIKKYPYISGNSLVRAVDYEMYCMVTEDDITPEETRDMVTKLNIIR